MSKDVCRKFNLFLIYCVKSVMFLNGKLKRRTLFQKCVCERGRNTSGLLYSIVQKGHKQAQIKAMETTVEFAEDPNHSHSRSSLEFLRD